LFYNSTTFNQDIGSWDVSKGTNFVNMFAYASEFNQDIGSSWNISKGTSFVSSITNDMRSFFLTYVSSLV